MRDTDARPFGTPLASPQAALSALRSDSIARSQPRIRFELAMVRDANLMHPRSIRFSKRRSLRHRRSPRARSPLAPKRLSRRPYPPAA